MFTLAHVVMLDALLLLVFAVMVMVARHPRTYAPAPEVTHETPEQVIAWWAEAARRDLTPSEAPVEDSPRRCGPNPFTPAYNAAMDPISPDFDLRTWF